MPYCRKCGKGLLEGADFCTSCGAPVHIPEKPARKIPVHHERDVLGAVSAGGFLIIIALMWLTYPDIFTIFVDYLKSFETYRGPVLPPYSLGQSIMFFFNLCGIWGLIIGSLRLILAHSPRKAVGDIAGAFFAFYLAFILSEYYSGIIAGRTLVPLFVVGLGILIVINVIGGMITSSLIRREIRIEH